VAVIPNWVDTATVVPQPRSNDWGREHGFDGRFVVMHSGNVGHAQNLDALVRSATFLRDLDDLTIAIVGNGARRDALIELAQRLDVDDTVVFYEYQDRSVLPYSLSSADVHVVGLAPGLSGYVVPSRLYGILSVAKPVIVAADAESETAQLVESVGCGVVVPPGHPEEIARAIRAAHDGELDLAAMGAAGHTYVAAEADRAVAVGRYRTLLREVVG
jgi:glycosyltransferase involved in cell wall biosynthesis